MIERCGYCNLVHETNEQPNPAGGSYKTCPMVPVDRIVAVAQPETTPEEAAWPDLLYEFHELTP